MDLDLTDDQRAFRDEVRTWLRSNVPSEPLPPADTRDGFEAHRSWERRLFDAGFAGISWPTEYGGRGADVLLQSIFEEEYILAGGPTRMSVLGQKLLGPTLMVHGSAEQRARWLPGILSGEAIWCQGFSEPSAGSDLAGIQTRATQPAGGDWTVTGQKIWTSYGAFADWMFALVRTSEPEPSRHAGLTMLAVDMRSPGVEARPIVQLDGHAGFAEVFLTEVTVPARDVIGGTGNGWQVAMTTLGVERDSPPAAAARYRRDVNDLIALLRAHGLAGDAVARDRVADLFVGAEVYRRHAQRALTRLSRGQSLGAEASVMKLLWSELERRVFETGMELLGPHGESQAGTVWLSRYWYGRAATIYAGTSEIQRNIVAERVLGLPRG